MTERPRAADPDDTGSAPGGSARGGPEPDRPAERVVIRDKRRIDPDGGRRRAPDDDRDAAGTATARGGGNHRSPDDDTPADEARGNDARGNDARGDDTPADDARGDATDRRDRARHARQDDQDEDEPAGGDAADRRPVVDDAELVEVLEAELSDGAEPAVVDEPTQPVSGPPEDRSGPLGAELEALRAELDERTRDLQRVSAEYANYRKRVDRDRGLAAEQTTGLVLTALLPVLDDLDRAREHGDLVGPFGTVAEQLTVALGKFGLTSFGEKGDPFDPTRHEAVAHQTSADVSEPTCVDVMRRGYLLGEKLLRPALVAVRPEHAGRRGGDR
nr:nucleotide exchange factor GrpE [Micromonospora sp. DSM 115978]